MEIGRFESMIDNSWNDESTINLLSEDTTISLENTTVRNVTNWFDNFTNECNESWTNTSVVIDTIRRDPLYVVVPITIIHVIIFITGIVGNVSTCVVIARNRSMHTATNYYLFSLAISDLLLLMSGLPSETYYIWSHYPYVFGAVFCSVQSYAAETSANATVLIITAFTVERYLAICHPFFCHTTSNLTRAVKYILGIWAFAIFLAVPQAMQFGITHSRDNNGKIIAETALCTRKCPSKAHTFEISTLLFFIVPMSIIIVLYVLIGVKLRRSRLLMGTGRNHIPHSMNHSQYGRRRSSSQRNVIRMLFAVVVAFFICWAPFHAQRLMAVYVQDSQKNNGRNLALLQGYEILTYISGILYYLSTAVNPLLYNIMSNKFREAFKSMLAEHCGGKRKLETLPRRPTYSTLSRVGKSIFKRNASRNSGFQSASEENKKFTAVPRNNVVQQLAAKKSDSSPIANERRRLNLVSRNNDDSSNECQPLNCRINDNRSSAQSSETSSQLSSPIVSRDCVISVNHHSVVSVRNCLRKNQRPHLKTVTLGLIAERLRFGTKGLFVNQHQRPHVQENQMHQQPRQRAIDGTTEIVGRTNPKFQSHPSMESANTISNSSLHDLDETEFMGSELATYMGQLNIDLVT